MFQVFHGATLGFRKDCQQRHSKQEHIFLPILRVHKQKGLRQASFVLARKVLLLDWNSVGIWVHRLISGAKGNRRSPFQDWLNCKEIQPQVNWLSTQWAGYAFCCFLRCFSDLTGMFCSVWPLWATMLCVWRKASGSAVCKHTSVVTPAFQLPLHTCQ